jgi:NADP-dependent 3-hydroxy acid dehydrogenase YdfG
MRILCTGNPDKLTIAWAVTQKWPNATTISLSSGWDFTNQQHIENLQKKIVEYDVFINSSYIAPGVQEQLMQIAVQEWMRANIKGHIFNVGTTIEWTNDQSSDYVRSKIALRTASLEINEQTGITGVKSTYLMLGGVNNQQPQTQDFVHPFSVTSLIEWIFQYPDRVGIIQLDKAK